MECPELALRALICRCLNFYLSLFPVLIPYSMKKIFTLFLLMTTSFCTMAQPGSNDPSFNVFDDEASGKGGFNGEVFSISIQKDGKILVGGEFNTFNGVDRSCIARLNANGSLDTSFDPGEGPIGGLIYDIAIQSDGKIIVGGDFTSYDGVPRTRIARINM